MLLPKVSALLIELHPGVQIAVICTGTDMFLLRLGPDGKPIKVENGDEAPCVLTETTLAATTDIPTWVAFTRS